MVSDTRLKEELEFKACLGSEERRTRDIGQLVTCLPKDLRLILEPKVSRSGVHM